MSPFAWLAPLKQQLFGKKITPFSRRQRIFLHLEILEDRWNPAPTVTGISPSIGQAVGGTNIVITGSEFTNATEVNFGADAALFFEVQDDTQIVAISPGGPDGIVHVTVVDPTGTSATSAADEFTYSSGPLITNVSPSVGPVAGGTLVSITGANLTDVTGVKFGDQFAESFFAYSDDYIEANSPPGIAGTVHITVITANGETPVSATDAFTYMAPPTATSISPNAGPPTGSTFVTITGTNLDDAISVQFGEEFGFIDTNTSTEITVFSPEGDLGTVDVIVTTANGTTAPLEFTYSSGPLITNVSPSVGPVAGGTFVAIFGANLNDVTGVKFGNQFSPYFYATSDGFNDSIQAQIPPGVGGTVHITVVTANGDTPNSPADLFTYSAAPFVYFVDPGMGGVNGGGSVTISGQNLNGATSVKFGNTPATSFTVISNTLLTAIVPPGALGTVDVTVLNAHGTSSASFGSQFTYQGAPTVTSVSPTSGPTVGQVSVTITGTNFNGVTAVKFGNVTLQSFFQFDDTHIEAVSPPGATGAVDVTVVTPAGTSAVSANSQFTYLPLASISSSTPTAGLAAGGTTVVITGINFANATSVKFGETNAASFVVDSPTQITAVTPPGIVDTSAEIIITTPIGVSVNGSFFNYSAPPTVTNVSPNNGTNAGGTFVTITGTHLDIVTSVKFGTQNAPQFFLGDSTSLVAVSPAGALGSVDITVTSPLGTSVISAADQFTYLPIPAVLTISPNVGAVGGGTQVTITGVNLANPTSVKFGDWPAASIVSSSPTQIVVISPPGVSGSIVYIEVATAQGNSVSTGSELFSYQGIPAVTSVSPTTIGGSGGQSVFISGSNFSGATAVMFGTAPAQSFGVISNNQIQAFSPPGSGTVHVTVTTPVGTSVVSAADQVTYAPPPVITSLSVATGPASGGTTVTITGTNFSNPTGVFFGEFSATIVSSSATQVVVTSPPNRLGTVHVQVSTAAGFSVVVAADQFTYVQGAIPVPAVANLSPGSGPLAGGTVVTITGTDLANASSVTFNGISATIVSTSPTQLVVNSPAFFAPNLVNVVITTPGGVNALTAPARFQYVSPPVATAFTTGPQSFLAGQTSGAILIGLKDAPEQAATAGAGGLTLTLATTSSNGTFFDLFGNPLAGNTITIPEGLSRIGFVYKDTTAGTPTITVNAANMPTITQQSTVAAANSALHVTNTLDDGAGSLRQAILAANGAPGSTIVFDAGAVGVINLLTALPNLTASMNIIGPGANLLTVQRGVAASTVFGILRVQAGATVRVTDLTLANSNSTGVANFGDLTLERVVIQGNHASGLVTLPPFGEAGGILNLGNLVVLQSTIANNSTTNALVAAGIDSESGSVVVINSTISGNLANNSNSAGGIGIYGGTLVLANSTITGNVANDNNTSGGGVDAHGSSNVIYNTIVAGNTGASGNNSDVGGVFRSLGHNLIGKTESHSSGFLASDLLGTLVNPIDAKLDANLVNNGGPTPTHALLSQSPALDAGDSTNAPVTDQRGLARISNGVIDIGAFERQLPPLTVLSDAKATFSVGQASTFNVVSTPNALGAFATLSTDGPLPGGISFTPHADGTATLGGAATPAVGTFVFDIHGTLDNVIVFTQTFTLTLLDPPAITSGIAATFTVGQLGTFNITTTPGLPSATTITKTAGTLPKGVTLSPAVNGIAKLSGIPTAGTGGVYSFTITASNSTTSKTTQAFTLTVNQAPKITSAAAATFVVGQFGTFTITTTGFPVAAITAGALPAGLSFTNNGNGTATLSGTPANGTASLTLPPVIITATNGVGTPATQNFKLTVQQSPVFTSVNAATFIAGQVNTFNVTTTPGLPTATTITKTAGTLPKGVTLVGAKLSGIPAAGTGGVYPFTITASNSPTSKTTQAFTLTVNQAPKITSAAAATFVVGQFGTFTFTTTGFPVAAIASSASPAGLTFTNNGNGTATLSGTPANGTANLTPYLLTLTATNGVGTLATQNFKLTIQQPPVITSVNAATFIAGQVNTFNVTTTPGLPAATTITKTAGTLPAGVTLVGAKLSGTPAAGAGGIYPFTITASNSTTSKTTQAFTLTVNQAPKITSAAAATFVVGQFGTFTITTTGFPKATITAGALPAGLNFTNNGNGTATLSGTPANGTASLILPPVVITATNGVGTPATQNFKLTVQQPPVVTSVNSATFIAGQNNTFNVTTTPGLPAATTITKTAGTLPAGVTLVGAKLSGMPTVGTGGVYPFTITASNSPTSKTTQAFTLTVNNAPKITSAAASTFVVGQFRTFTITTTGFPAAAITAGALPAGLNFTNNGNGTATLSGTPANGAANLTPYALTLTATNGVGTPVTQNFKLTVQQPPAITSVNAVMFIAGQNNTFNVTTTPGVPAATTITKTAGTLPAGVTLVGAKLSGIPAIGTGGVYPFTITASNSAASKTTQVFTLTVNAAPKFTSAATATFVVGQPANFVITTKGFPAATLVKTGALPAGLSFTDNGNGTATLNGIPAAATGGSYSFTISATNVVATVNLTFKLILSHPPAFSSLDHVTFTRAASNTFTITTTGFPTSPRIAISGKLPVGVTFVNKGNGTAILSGKPTVAGTFKFAITVSNGILPDAIQEFTLTVI
jgi:hypothetical protein